MLTLCFFESKDGYGEVNLGFFLIFLFQDPFKLKL